MIKQQIKLAKKLKKQVQKQNKIAELIKVGCWINNQEAHNFVDWWCGCSFGCDCCKYNKSCTRCNKLI